ncbi:MAG: cyclase family protein [Thermaerobacter sp.]|nr:cyclase family protein [Thermaerobacter sp.]
MQLIDLTIPIEHGMKSFPGEPGGFVMPFADLATQGFVAHQVLLYTHIGTHLDAPRHFLPDGEGVEAWPLEQLCGPAMVVRMRAGAQGPIDIEDFVWPRPPQAGDRVLLATGWGAHWGEEDYFRAFPSLSLHLCTELASARIALLGMDIPTPSEHEAQGVHEALLLRRVAVLEGLIRLDELPGDFGELLCLPLLLQGLDGAPCRVAFRTEEQK